MRELGQKRGAEEVLVYLNPVFDSLIGELHLYGGVVIGFAGDSITCWLEGDNGRRAVACALAMQEVMVPYADMRTEEGTPFSLHIKVAITAGPARRFTVGLPEVQLVDVLAGDTLIRMAAAEGLAERGETVVEEIVISRLKDSLSVDSWRSNEDGLRVGIVSEMFEEPIISPWPDLSPEVLDADRIQSWLLRPVQERILAGRGFLAELRPAVALFMRFTGIDYDRDDEAGSKLTDFICWVQGVIQRTDGYLIQLTVGDKGSFLYVAYGAPIGHDDNAVRAVAAALELRTKSTSFVGIDQVQIGVSAGRMWTGAYGASTRRTYGVMGNETNMAARLMGKAKPGQILITRQVLDATEHHYRVEDLGEIQVKGSKDPLPIWEVIDRSRGTAGEWAQFDTALVGRLDSQARLSAMLDDVLNSNGRAVQIIGDAGMGKSHLASHFSQDAVVRDVRVAVAACQSITRSSAYYPWRQIFRLLLELEHDDDDETISSLTSYIEKEHSEWLLRLPLLGDLLALPIPDNPTMAALDASLRQSSLFSLVVEMIQMWAKQDPLLLVIENAHWMDEASTALSEAVVQQLHEGHRVFVLLVHRPQVSEDEGWLGALSELSHHEVIQLQEMPDDEIADLILARLDGSADRLPIDVIHDRARGNPLFAGELVDALCQSGELVKEPNGQWRASPEMMAVLRAADVVAREEGHWRLKPGVELSTVKLGIPDSIHGIVIDRLDRLPESHKLTLKVGSVIGHQFELPMVKRAHPEDKRTDELRHEADFMEGQELLQREITVEDLYAFRHHSTQEVAYETLLYTQRQQLHSSVAQALVETQSPMSTQIAHHAYLGQEWSLSLDYNLKSGEQAKRLYANQQSIDFFEKALQSAEAVVDEDTDEQRKAIHLALGELLVTISQYEPADEHLRAALELSQSLGDKVAEARACRWVGRSHELRSDFATALAWLDEGLSSVEGLNSTEEAEIYILAGLIHSRQGEYDRSIQLADRSLILADKLDDDTVRARAFGLLGIVALRHGDGSTAVKHFIKSLGYHERLEDVYGQATSHNLIANGYFPLGEWTKADHHYRRSLRQFTQIGSIFNQVFVNNNLGGIALKQGRLDDALESYSRAVELLEQIGGSVWVLGALHMNIGSTHIRRRELEAAEAELKLAQKYFDETQLRDLMPELYGLFAELALVQGDLAEAELHGGHSLDLAREMEFALEEGHNLRIMGEIALAREEFDSAAQILESSNTILDDAGDQYERAKTQLSLAQLYIALGQNDLADIEFSNCLETFELLDAHMDLDLARELQRSLR
jgi:class 3 adenylate cyclase/tetratricopeptide (TPR) repeat protein